MIATSRLGARAHIILRCRRVAFTHFVVCFQILPSGNGLLKELSLLFTKLEKASRPLAEISFRFLGGLEFWLLCFNSSLNSSDVLLNNLCSWGSSGLYPRRLSSFSPRLGQEVFPIESYEVDLSEEALVGVFALEGDSEQLGEGEEVIDGCSGPQWNQLFLVPSGG